MLLLEGGEAGLSRFLASDMPFNSHDSIMPKSANLASSTKLNHENTMRLKIRNVTINYAILETNKTVLDAIPCRGSSPCNSNSVFGFEKYSTHKSIVDNERKILMEYTPKAGCTSAVAMFMNHMGFIYQKTYSIFPHRFRHEYFQKKCGMGATPCMLESPEWYRFKVVRNPYDRAVSSYLQVMNFTVLQNGFIPPHLSKNCTFLQFLELLEQVPRNKMTDVGAGHVGYQANAIEQHLFFDNPKNITLFHQVIPLEELETGLKLVNRATHSNFQVADRGPHLPRRRNRGRQFMGNVPFSMLKDRIPSNYGVFYNQHIQALVQKIYGIDLLVYNYSFPFTYISYQP
jgi:hypothetical protein